MACRQQQRAVVISLVPQVISVSLREAILAVPYAEDVHVKGHLLAEAVGKQVTTKTRDLLRARRLRHFW